jgi:hypothetical protein
MDRDTEHLERRARVAESALAQSQRKCAMLREQMARLQRQTGVIQGMNAKEIGAYAGADTMTVRQWVHRYPQALKPIPDTYPRLYERGAVDNFLAQHPRLKRTVES